MFILNRFFLFLQRQVSQIWEGGVRVFYRKGKKLLKLLCMEFFAPLAVYLKINWPDAYYFMGKKLETKYYKMQSQANTDRISIKDIRNKSITCLEKYSASKSNSIKITDWIEANKSLNSLFWQQGKIKECINICQRVAAFRQNLMKDHQLDKLDIEFIPRAFAVGSIGVYEILTMYVMAGILEMRTPKQLILLLDLRSSVNNPCYLNYWRRYVTIISDPLLIELLSPLEEYLTTPINLVMSLHGKIGISHLAIGRVQKRWDAEKRPSILTLSNEDYKRGWQCLRAFGLPEDAWFVCLHVREPGWRDGGASSESFRNADINTYLPAIKAIVDAGGWVLRMGDPISMTPLPSMDHVIDYAHSDVKSDWMDIFCLSQCRFLVGTDSGPTVIPVAFGVPVVFTNFLSLFAIYSFSRKDIFLPRRCWSKNKNRYLSLRELISPPAGMACSQYIFDMLGLKVVENEPEEIRDVVVEMLQRCEGTLRYSEEDEYLQERFSALAASCGKLYGDKDIVVNARISRKFLREHASLLPNEEGEVLEEPHLEVKGGW